MKTNGGTMLAGTMDQSELPFTVIPRGLLSGVSPWETNTGRATSKASPTPRLNFLRAGRCVIAWAIPLVSSSNLFFITFLSYCTNDFVLGSLLEARELARVFRYPLAGRSAPAGCRHRGTHRHRRRRTEDRRPASS